MKLFLVSNKFSNYSLTKYVVIANNEEAALSIAGEKLKSYALETRFSCNESAYAHMGLKVINIFTHVDTPEYYDYFKIKTLSEDIEQNVISEV